MEKFFRQYDWVIKLAAIGIGAILTAFIFNNMAASYLAPYTVPDLPKYETSSRKPEKPTSQVPGNRPGTLLNRCIVGCKDEENKDPNECPGGCDKGEVCKKGKCVPEEPDKEDKDKPDVPVRSELDIELLGTIVANNPAHSKAMLRKQNDNKQLIAGLGDYITDKAKIIEITRSRIIIKRKEKLEFIPIKDSIYGGPTPSVDLTYSTYQPSKPNKNKSQNRDQSESDKKAQGPSQDDNGSGADSSDNTVRKTGNQEWEVKGKALNKYLDKPEQMAKQGRLIPNYNRKEKTREGLKVTGLPPGSIYSKIGFETGDVLLSINGEALKNRRQAYELLKTFKSGNSVEIKVKRGDNIQTFRYKVE
jgi:type II secretion system protein C